MMLAQTLGLAVQFVPDPEARMQRRWQRRINSYMRPNDRVSKAAIKKATPIVVAELARKGGRLRCKSPQERAAVGKFLAERRHTFCVGGPAMRRPSCLCR
jgi:hypothetical protein